MPPRRAIPFVQRLEGLDLTVERATDRTPDRSRYHVLYRAKIVGSFRTLPEASALFRELRDGSGWSPPETQEVSGEERLRREREAKDRLDYLDYWGSSHQFKGGGRPKRRQR